MEPFRTRLDPILRNAYRSASVHERMIHKHVIGILVGMSVLVLVAARAEPVPAPDRTSEAGSNEVRRASVEMLRRELEWDPSNLRAALALGGILRRQGETDEAREIVDKAMQAARERIARDGDSVEQRILLGSAAVFLGRGGAAVKQFESALLLEPEREEIHLGLVRALFGAERLDEAEQALELARSLFPDSAAVKSQAAELHELRGRFDRAIPLLEELRSAEDSPSVSRRLVQAYMRTDEAEKAVNLIRELADAGKLGRLEADLNVFQIRLSNGDLRAARVQLQRAAETDAGHPAVKRAFNRYYAVRADDAEAENNYRRAILFWERAHESHPEDPGTRYRYGKALAMVEDYEKTLEQFLPLLKQQPPQPEFYADLALTLIALEQYESADRVVQLGFNVATELESEAGREVLADVSKRLEQKRRELAGKR